MVGIRNTAKNLLKNAEEQIPFFRKCAECYANKKEDIHLVCSKPHLAIWAQFDSYPYWPAKLLSVDKATKKFEVYFFDDHTTESVLFENCYLYRNKDPNTYITDEYKDGVKKAMDVRPIYPANHAKIILNLEYFTVGS